MALLPSCRGLALFCFAGGRGPSLHPAWQEPLLQSQPGHWQWPFNGPAVQERRGDGWGCPQPRNL